MSDTHPNRKEDLVARQARDPTNGQGANGSNDMESLKDLLFGAEKAELEKLAQQVESTSLNADNLAKILPGAFRKADATDDRLSNSLSPMIGSALKTSIKKEPQSIVDAISPIMGPAIRDSIRQAIRGMVQSLNKTLEYSVSAKGLKWRWEALTTGKTFGEVVLLHTLRYRVEQIFLIHRETGLLLQHVTEDEDIRDVDLASGMLTAIQDFVRDSFGAEEHESLKTMAFGNQTIWIETGPKAFLAAVIEGEAPSALHEELNECLESIHVDLREPLETYNGDDREFAAAQPVMQECLLSAYENDIDQSEATQPYPIWKKVLWSAVLIGLLCAIGYGIMLRITVNRMRNIRRSLGVPSEVASKLEEGRLTLTGPARNDWITEVQRTATREKHVEQVDVSGLENQDQNWLDYLQQLDQIDGITVVDSRIREDSYEVNGLRDPLAEDPVELLEQHELSPAKVRSSWQFYNSLHTDFLRARVVKAIAPPEEISISENENVVSLSGAASTEWIRRVREIAQSVGQGMIELNIDKLENIDAVTLEAKAKQLERIFFIHDAGKPTVVDGQQEAFDRAISTVRELLQLAKIANQSVRITIVGRSTKQEQRNLSQQRASMVWKRFNEANVGDEITIKGVHTKPLDAGSSAKVPAENVLRSSVFSVTIQ